MFGGVSQLGLTGGIFMKVSNLIINFPSQKSSKQDSHGMLLSPRFDFGVARVCTKSLLFLFL